MAELIEAFNAADLSALREKADNCPACIMSVIIQTFDGDSDNWVDFDYKKEKQAWDDARYAERIEAIGGGAF